MNKTTHHLSGYNYPDMKEISSSARSSREAGYEQAKHSGSQSRSNRPKMTPLMPPPSSSTINKNSRMITSASASMQKLSPLSPLPPQISAPPISINREAVCPLLLRMFCDGRNDHHDAIYARGETPTTSCELQVYTWLDATLKELSDLIKEVNPEHAERGTHFKFAVIKPSRDSPRYTITQIGTVCSGITSDENNISLGQVDFTIGDFIDVSIIPPIGGSRYIKDLTQLNRDQEKKQQQQYRMSGNLGNGFSSGGGGGNNRRADRRYANN